MKTHLLLKASMIGIVIIVVLSLISTAASYPILQDMMTMFSDPAFLETPPTRPMPGTSPSGMPLGFERFFSLIPILGLVGCLSLLIPGIVAGFFYARWHNQEKPLTLGAVKGAGAAGAIAQAIGYTISGFVGMAVMLPMQLQMMETMLDATGAPPAAMPLGGSMILFGAISLVCNAIFQALLGAGFGAIGGLIGDSMSKNKPYDYAGGDVLG